MRDFIDLQGASGATYRFRLWPQDTAHLPVAGNYAVLREAGEGFDVLQIDISDNLAVAREGLNRRFGGDGDVRVYTRLNVSRTIRRAEHDDLSAHYRPAEGDTDTPPEG